MAAAVIPVLMVLAAAVVWCSGMAFMKRPERSVRLVCWCIGLCVGAAALSGLTA